MDVEVRPARAALPSGALPVATLSFAVLALAALALSLAQAVPAGRTPAFDFLLRRDEPSAAWLSCAIVLAAALLSRRIAAEGVVAKLAARPFPFVGAVAVALAAAAVLIYRAHPLSMDESAPLFQARAFARFALAGKVPPEIVPRLIPTNHWFIEANASGELISAYWPGFALLLTPFVWLGCPWLLNPLIGGATLYMVWRLARRFWPETDAAGWALVLCAASPAFTVNAFSFYSMSAHLLGSLVFAWLVLENRLVLAGVVGSLALSLHNPLPHALFAAPWIVALAARPGRFRQLLRLALGYLPGTVVLVLGWVLLRAHFGPGATAHADAAAPIARVVKLAFSLPDLNGLRDRAVNLAELSLWAVPALLPLAVWGGWLRRHEPGPRLIAVSALLVFAAYFLVTFDQGHGWGYRYFHPAWGALPLLGAGALVHPRVQPAVRRFMAAAAAASLLVCTALRCAQVRTFIDAQLAQIPATDASGSKLEVVMVRIARGYYTIDLVQNDPFLDGARWMLFSAGEADEQRFMAQAFPGARMIESNATASVWQVR